VLLALPTPRLEGDEVRLEPLNLVFGRRYLLTVQWGDQPELAEARARWETLPPAERRQASRLAGTVTVAVLAGYAPVLERITERLEAVQAGIFRGSRDRAPRELATLKRSLLALRRALYPLGERVTQLRAAAAALYPGEGAAALLPAAEEAQRLRDELDLQAEAADDAMDAHLAEASNGLSRTMNLLTVLGVCLAVMGAIFGAWGMNFEVIPIAKHRWGFWLVFALIAVLCGGLLIGTRLQGVW
jgi:magnesium transporter